MKNLFFPLMFFAAALSSCSQDDASASDYTVPSDSDLVSLNVYAGTTKGSDTTTGTLETSAYVELHIDDSDGVEDTYEFRFTSNDWKQTDADQLKWSGIVFPANFYSLHDGVAPKNLNFGTDNATLTGYTVTGNSDTHADLVFHASQIDAIPAGGLLKVHHKHALSKLNLLAKTGNMNVYIARAKLINVDGEGNVTITPLLSDENSNLGVKWDNATSTNDKYQYYYIGTESATALNSTINGSDPLINKAATAPMMIIPQLTTAATSDKIKDGDLTGSYIEIIYYMTDAAGNPKVGYSKVSERPDANDYIPGDQNTTLYVKGAFPLAYDFEPNKEYDISLGLGAENTTGGILIDDFYVDKDGDPIELTKKDDSSKETPEVPDVDEGDDILGNLNGLIDIQVSSCTWDDGGVIPVEHSL